MSSSAVPFYSCLQSFPASESFLISQFFASGGQLDFSFSISPSIECSGLISFRRDWLDLLAVQGTLKSLLQHHSSKAPIFWHSDFFVVQLSHPYMTTRKTIALTRWTFVGKVMSLLSNILSRLVIAFLPKSKHLLISWLQSPSQVILEPPNLTLQKRIAFSLLIYPTSWILVLVSWNLAFSPKEHISKWIWQINFFLEITPAQSRSSSQWYLCTCSPVSYYSKSVKKSFLCHTI